jgi:DNA-binding transcriptional ArsR family regulator
MPTKIAVADLDLTSPTCCSPLTDRGLLEADAARELALRLKALADPARLQIVSLLLCAPGKELCTCDIAPAVGLKDATVSHHLKQLLETGLVTKRRDGMNVHYRLVPDAVRALARVFDIDCC